MSEVEIDGEKTVELEISDPGRAAIERHYMRQGKALEDMRLSLANLAQEGLYVYQLQLRWPTKGKPNHMLILKALQADGPVIAFHGDYGWVSALLGVAQRLRAGDLDWHQDDYPPEDWMERLTLMHTETHYLD